MLKPGRDVNPSIDGEWFPPLLGENRVIITIGFPPLGWPHFPLPGKGKPRGLPPPPCLAPPSHFPLAQILIPGENMGGREGRAGHHLRGPPGGPLFGPAPPFGARGARKNPPNPGFPFPPRR